MLTIDWDFTHVYIFNNGIAIGSAIGDKVEISNSSELWVYKNGDIIFHLASGSYIRR